MTIKWIEVNYSFGDQDSVNTNLKFKTPMLKSNLCDYSDANIVAKCTRDLLTAAANENDKALKGVAFKNNAPFRSCVKKINNILTGNAEDLDMVMWMYIIC